MLCSETEMVISRVFAHYIGFLDFTVKFPDIRGSQFLIPIFTSREFSKKFKIPYKLKKGSKDILYKPSVEM